MADKQHILTGTSRTGRENRKVSCKLPTSSKDSPPWAGVKGFSPKGRDPDTYESLTADYYAAENKNRFDNFVIPNHDRLRVKTG